MFRFLLALSVAWPQAFALTLNAEQNEALLEARRRYKVRVLDHPDGDIVILLGESRIKTRESHDLGQALLEVFGVRGLEAQDGAAPSRRLQREEKITAAIFESANKVTRGHGPYRSTLAEALSVEPLPTRGDLQIVPLEKRGPGEGSHFTTSLVKLEYTLAQFAIPLSFVTLLGINRVTIKYLSHVAPALIVSLVLGSLFARPWGEASFAERVAFHVYYGAVERRDTLMAKNIVKTRPDRPDQPLLVIVSASHVQGVANLLKSQYGYDDVEFASDSGDLPDLPK